MSIRTRCQACGATYSARDDLAGKTVPCSKCGGAVVVPAFATPEPDQPAGPYDDLFSGGAAAPPPPPKPMRQPPAPPPAAPASLDTPPSSAYVQDSRRSYGGGFHIGISPWWLVLILLAVVGTIDFVAPMITGAMIHRLVAIGNALVFLVCLIVVIIRAVAHRPSEAWVRCLGFSFIFGLGLVGLWATVYYSHWRPILVEEHGERQASVEQRRRAMQEAMRRAATPPVRPAPSRALRRSTPRPTVTRWTPPTNVPTRTRRSTTRQPRATKTATPTRIPIVTPVPSKGPSADSVAAADAPAAERPKVSKYYVGDAAWDLPDWEVVKVTNEKNPMGEVCAVTLQNKTRDHTSWAGVSFGCKVADTDDPAYIAFRRAHTERLNEAIRQTPDHKGSQTLQQTVNGVEFQRITAYFDDSMKASLFVGVQDGRAVAYWFVGHGGRLLRIWKQIGKATPVPTEE